MASLILHKLNPSPPSRAVMIMGEILGLKFHYKDMLLMQKDHLTPNYTDMNPMRTIPVLKDGDFVLADSHAICTYLVNKYGGEKRELLYPSEAHARAVIDQRLHFDSGVLFPRMAVIGFAALRGQTGGADVQQINNIENGYDIINNYLEKTKYLAADHVTVADVCAGATVTSHEIIIEVNGDKYPRTKEWIEDLKSKLYFRKQNAPGIEEYRQFLNSCFEKFNKRK